MLASKKYCNYDLNCDSLLGHVGTLLDYNLKTKIDIYFYAENVNTINTDSVSLEIRSNKSDPSM